MTLTPPTLHRCYKHIEDVQVIFTDKIIFFFYKFAAFLSCIILRLGFNMGWQDCVINSSQGVLAFNLKFRTGIKKHIEDVHVTFRGRTKEFSTKLGHR